MRTHLECLTLTLALLALAPSCHCPPRAPQAKKTEDPQRPRKVDVHVHVSPSAVPRLVALMDERGIDVAVNLSGGWPGEGLEEAMAAARRAPGRIIVFANPPLWRLRSGPVDFESGLVEAQRLGARGVKIYKALGLGYRASDGTLLAVDDPRLDRLFEKAGALGLPVAIHTGDPVAFWAAPDEHNERIDELRAHPEWSNFGKGLPSWEALFEAFERRVARHPHTHFIGVHFGNAPEFPERVERLLETHPNLWVDTAARVPELGRKSAQVRALIERFPDRVLFGTDLGVGDSDEELMLGSTGRTPPTRADVDRFFSSTWRFFETEDQNFAHPTPIQGRWTISGLRLSPTLQRKVYAENAARLLVLP